MRKYVPKQGTSIELYLREKRIDTEVRVTYLSVAIVTHVEYKGLGVETK
jgi:hypothetical protein